MKGHDQCKLGLEQLIPGNYSEGIRDLCAGPEQDGGFDTSPHY